jgi:membrane protein DedA with SNARE-associated domain
MPPPPDPPRTPATAPPAAAAPSVRLAARWGLVVAAVLAVILVPFALAGAHLDAWSVAQLQALHNPRLVALLVVALLAGDVLLPVPSSIVATLAGASLGFAGALAATLVGMSAGCVLAYALGRWAGAPLVDRLVGPREAARLHEMGRRHGDWSLVLARAVPVLAEGSTILAGAAAMPFVRFLIVTTAANLGIAAVYSAVGAYAADVRSFLLAVAGAVLVPLAGSLLLRLLPGGTRAAA